MRWRALQVGRIYIKQHPHDAQLSVQDLKDMVGQQGERFSKQVTHFGNTLRGTASYWFRQRSRLISMVDTLGLPTVFFTHSAADLQWPELAQLMCPDDPNDPRQRHKALVQNPAIADWFFYQRVQVYLKHFYTDVLGATDYWLRFEWQHRGSPHVHGLAWLPNAPNIEQAFASGSADTVTTNNITQYIDSVVCTSNPAMCPGSVDTTCPPQTNPHVCNKPFSEVEDYEQDLAELIATCQRHTRCSPAHCLRMKNGKQVCRFGYPKPLQEETTLGMVDGELELNTARNDPLVNSYNRIQLSSWRANVDMQYCLSRQKVIEYVVKYASKCEPRSEPLKKVYKGIVQALSDDDKSVKAVQKLLLNSVGERDFSAQETCHLLLQLPLIMCSREFIVLSLDGSRAVEDSLEEDKPATKLSILDHYKARPESCTYEHMTLMNFAQNYTMPHNLGDEPTHKTKKVVVVVRPYFAKDPNSPQFEQYCKQKLMLHVPFRSEEELLDGQNTYTEAYARFVMSGNAPQCLQDDIDTFMQQARESDSDESEGEVINTNDNSSNARQVEEWMLICQSYPQLDQHNDTHGEDVDWLEAGRAYPNLEETPRFIIKHKESQVGMASTCTHTNDPQLLQGKQLHVYREVQAHLEGGGIDPLHMIVSGTAGTGKSFLIGCLRALLTNKVRVVAPTGVAAFNIHGCTLHSLLSLPTRGEFKDLEGERLHSLQQTFAEVRYIIIDEMSMVGRKLFGQVDKRLRQAFPHRADEVLGGCSCILFGDFGQLPPVMDLPLYSADARSALSDLGRTAYQCFDKAVVLTQVMRQAGEDPQQVRFRDILMPLRDGHLTTDDWKHLMTRSAACVTDFGSFNNALHLYPTVESVAEHNLTKLKHCTHPVAQIKAIHNGPRADRASSDDASGLEAVIHIAKGARVMLISNLWIEAGLVNGAMGTVEAICYQSGGPPALPTAVMVRFDAYTGPTLSDGTVPIVPVCRSCMSGSSACSRLQLPLKLAWAITIHKAQGLTLDKVVLDIGPKEFCAGLTFVALSRVRNLNSLAFHPSFDFQRVASLAKSQRLIERCSEDCRLLSLSNNRD